MQSPNKLLAKIGSYTLLATAFLCVFPLTGCIGYRLGSMLPPNIKTVYVPTFVNNTTEPQIEGRATDATMIEIQRDGSLKIVTNEDEADAILKVTLTSYRIEPLTFDESDPLTANEYRAVLSASILMIDRKTGAVIVENPKVEGKATFIIAGDMSSSKLRALPELTKDLAVYGIVEKIVETW